MKITISRLAAAFLTSALIASGPVAAQSAAQSASQSVAQSAAQSASADSAPLVRVWKSPTCGCCNDWIAHLKSNGFRVETHDVGNDAARSRLGMPLEFASCHTATVGGYVLEGHVPAQDIRRLLQERRAARGLAVPGMPVGSPGMDTPVYQGRKDPYDVMLVERDGKAKVYRSYNR